MLAQKTEVKTHRCDVLIVGSGLAGLAMALKSADLGSVVILSKTQRPDGNSTMAQGGIAAAISEKDSPEKHVQDTLMAGAGLCRPDVVKQVVDQAVDRIMDLEDWGVEFDRLDKEKLSLHKEGGHSHRRILHIEDSTGREIHKVLLQRVIDHPNIEILHEQMALELILNQHLVTDDFQERRCVGAYSLHIPSGEVQAFLSRTTVLATGGAGKVYLYTSNWDGATGDGIAMAYRAGARVGNLEFMQFHPTCLYHVQNRSFLISEALRGEGGRLLNSRNEDFMNRYHDKGTLAPRDIVARSIDTEMKRLGDECVYLDMTHHDQSFLQRRFPLIYEKCKTLGFSIEEQAIPVVPAAHYLCGGVWTNPNGQTDIPGLFAVGETAFCGLHGANRLASNSLLECMAYAHNCSELLRSGWSAHWPSIDFPNPTWMERIEENSEHFAMTIHLWDEIRRSMWNYVGIVRSDLRLEKAQVRLKAITAEVDQYYQRYKLHPDIIELRNLCKVAELTVECALKRKESRGIHFNLDYPQTQNELARDTLI